MAVEVRRPDLIMKESVSACSHRPRSPLRSSVGIPLLRYSPHSWAELLFQAAFWRFHLMTPQPYQRKRHRRTLGRRPVDIFRSALSTQSPCTFRLLIRPAPRSLLIWSPWSWKVSVKSQVLFLILT